MAMLKVRSILIDDLEIDVSGDPHFYLHSAELDTVSVFMRLKEDIFYVGREHQAAHPKIHSVLASFDTKSAAEDYARQVCLTYESETPLLDQETKFLRGLNLSTRDEVAAAYAERYPNARKDSTNAVVNELCERLGL